MSAPVRRGIRIELIDPLVSSQGTASAVDPASLPYIPGAMLWGIVANVLYRAEDPSTFDSLHAGRISFDDGLPLTDRGPAFPVPMSLHLPKGDKPSSLAANKLDLTEDSYRPAIRQQRGWSITSGQTPCSVRFTVSTRTAILPGKGVASEGQLYSLQALEAGQQFLSVIEGATDTEVERVLEILCGTASKEHLLGRSKSAEFGRCRLSRCDPWALNTVARPAKYVWCLSDVAAHDIHGSPTLRPDAGVLGAAIDWNRSFLRHRRYTPYNATWDSRAPERLVIERGSILALEGGDLRSGLHRVGLYRETGLGLVMALPEAPGHFIETLPATPVRAQPADQPRSPSAAPRKEGLVAWLVADLAWRNGGVGLEAEVRTKEDIKIWMKRYTAARRLLGSDAGPGPSQWGVLASAQDPRALLEAVAADDSNKEATTWNARFKQGDDGTFIAAALTALDNLGTPEAFRVLAKMIRTELVELRT